MNKKIDISVVVPVYNAEDTLEKCIDSVLAQSFMDFELLLVNDGSEDKSGVICDFYEAKDSRVIVFHQSNRGVSSARNCGLDNSSGNYIVFIDSDDWVDVSYLEGLLYELLVNNVDLVDQSFKRLGFDGQLDEVYESIKINNSNILAWIEMLFEGQTSPFPKIFKNDIIRTNNVRFDESVSLCEDLVFILNYMQFVKKGVYFSATSAYNYKYSPKSLSNSVSKRVMTETYIPLKVIFETLTSEFYRQSSDDILSLSSVRNKLTLLSMFFLNNLNTESVYNQRVEALANLKPYGLDKLWMSIKSKNPLRRMFYFFYRKGCIRCAVRTNDLIVRIS